MASLLRVCRKALTSTATAQPLLWRGYAVESAAAIRESPDRVKWDYRGQRRIIPLGQWLPKIAVDAYVAPNVVLAGQVIVGDGSSVWNGSVLRGDLNKITIGFCCNIQERCVIHAAWNSPTGQDFLIVWIFLFLFGWWENWDKRDKRCWVFVLFCVQLISQIGCRRVSWDQKLWMFIKV